MRKILPERSTRSQGMRCRCRNSPGLKLQFSRGKGSRGGNLATGGNYRELPLEQEGRGIGLQVRKSRETQRGGSRLFRGNDATMSLGEKKEEEGQRKKAKNNLARGQTWGG